MSILSQQQSVLDSYSDPEEQELQGVPPPVLVLEQVPPNVSCDVSEVASRKWKHVDLELLVYLTDGQSNYSSDYGSNVRTRVEEDALAPSESALHENSHVSHLTRHLVSVNGNQNWYELSTHAISESCPDGESVEDGVNEGVEYVEISSWSFSLESVNDTFFILIYLIFFNISQSDHWYFPSLFNFQVFFVDALLYSLVDQLVSN